MKVGCWPLRLFCTNKGFGLLLKPSCVSCCSAVSLHSFWFTDWINEIKTNVFLPETRNFHFPQENKQTNQIKSCFNKSQVFNFLPAISFHFTLETTYYFYEKSAWEKTQHINCSTVCHNHCATKSFFLAKIIAWILQKLPDAGDDQVWAFHPMTYQDPKSHPPSILAVQQGIPVSLICATNTIF